MKTIHLSFKFNDSVEQEKITEILVGLLDRPIHWLESVKEPFNNIRQWAAEKGIYEKGDPKTQTLKLGEEFGELSKAIINNDQAEIQDAIGDCVVVLTSIAHMRGLSIEECIESAYNVIVNRKGKMENGSFIKES